MSGPKTSRLEIERRIQAQLAALRSDVDRGRARARRRIAARRDELLALAAECEEGEGPAADIRATASRALARLDGECIFAPDPRMESSVESAARCTASATAIADAFETEADALAGRIERARAHQEDLADARDFAALLQAAADRTGDASAASGSTDAARQSQRESALASALSGDAQAVAARALALVNDPCTLPADRALLLDTVRSFGPQAAPQLALLLPAMEASARAMADLAAPIDDAAAQLAARGLAAPASPATFATLEEAAAHLEALRGGLAQADRDAYLQACIDAVMARHGYDIARSVRMGRDLAGTHRLYGSAAGTEGIHAFVSDQGDLMLQVAGTPRGLANVEDGDEVSLEAAPEGLRSEALLKSQNDFCAVYDEIADELAEFGIVNSVRYKTAPDAAFCREVVKVQDADTADTPAAAQRRRRKAGEAAREMS